jgi:AcrR family transcriptional regulator
MSGPERRSQVLGIAAGEFANHGLHGASIAAIAHEAGITQAYVCRMFGTKKALFVELVGAAFEQVRAPTSAPSSAWFEALSLDSRTLSI